MSDDENVDHVDSGTPPNSTSNSFSRVDEQENDSANRVREEEEELEEEEEEEEAKAAGHLVGKFVEKSFENHGVIIRDVTRFLPRKKAYFITYEDGDREEMDTAEVMAHLVGDLPTAAAGDPSSDRQ